MEQVVTPDSKPGAERRESSILSSCTNAEVVEQADTPSSDGGSSECGFKSRLRHKTAKIIRYEKVHFKFRLRYKT